jgi:hypothetical protein
MRQLLTAVCLVMFVSLANAQRLSDDERAQMAAYHERLWKIEERAGALYPRRRDTPMRDLNISDNEVREIEAIARRHLLNSMLNISPVVAGCACEEGPLCTDQVFVVATTATQTVSLQLSRIRNAWVVGPVQRWWTQFSALQARRSEMGYRRFDDAKNQLLLDFPMCVGRDDSVEPPRTTAQSRDAPKKQ